MNVVQLENVKKYYQLGQTRVEALRGVPLSIEQGEFLTIAGPSGSGKTTMLNMFGCIDIPTEGTVRIAGTETEKMTDKELRLSRNLGSYGTASLMSYFRRILAIFNWF